jgi:hypothetical protein
LNISVPTLKYYSISFIEILPIELNKEKGNEFLMTYVKILRWKIINSNKGFLEAYNSTSLFLRKWIDMWETLSEKRGFNQLSIVGASRLLDEKLFILIDVAWRKCYGWYSE